MGDCRLHLQYVGSLAAELSVPDSSSDETSSPSCSKSDNGSSCWFVSSPSADTTLRQYADAVLSDLQHRRLHRPSEPYTSTGNNRVPVPPSFKSGTSNSLLLYDMTLHPPRNVTPTIASHSALTGPNSKTLNQMGWFPSARLAVCYERDIGSKDNDSTDAVQCMVDMVGEGAGDEETGEYNRTKRLAVDDRARMVKLTGPDNDESAGDGHRPKVSEMMAAVENRDIRNGDAPIISKDSAATERAKKAAAKRKQEARRTARLDEAIRRIDECNKKSSSKRSKTNANISAQVKKMLVKSRAVGKKSLREEDRFYIEVLFVDDTVPDRTFAGGEGKEHDTDGESSSYHFFSRVAKVGSVASNSIATDAGTTVEVLVKTIKAEDNSKEYRRLPNLMALHEAEEQGYLNQFDRVVVRKHRLCSIDDNDEGSGPTKSVLDADEDVDEGRARSSDRHGAATFGTSEDKKASPGDDHATTSGQKGTAVAATCTENDTADSSSAATLSLCHKISQAIEDAEASKTKGSNAKKKKKSSTSEKVRQMLIKGKAKGDKKAVKEQDRYYLEAILVREDSLTGSITANTPPAPYFFHRMTSIEASILKALGVSSKDIASVELYVRESRDGQGDIYGRLEDVTMRLCDAEEKISALQQFSCVVVKQIIDAA